MGDLASRGTRVDQEIQKRGCQDIDHGRVAIGGVGRVRDRVHRLLPPTEPKGTEEVEGDGD